jgi:UDP-N-acetylmuramate dehydrogenase
VHELARHTTLRLGGPARAFTEAATEDQVVATVREADRQGGRVLILGGGSNLVVADDGFDGTVIRIATRGVGYERADVTSDRAAADGNAGAAVMLRVQAGEDWAALVSRCVADGLAGVECLAGIPGLVGATPIQNVGAYGQEAAETVSYVRALDRHAGQVVTLGAESCGFGYRTSMFKRHPDRFVIVEAGFRLDAQRLSRPLAYPELAATLGARPGDRAPLGEVADAVLALRRKKGMVLDPGDPDTRSAGSFFVNPVLSADQAAALEKEVHARLGPDARFPRFPAPGGGVKVPAAWLIEQAGFGKGYGHDGDRGARISAKHTLALINPGNATTAELVALAREIRDGVRFTFGVELVNEPVLVGVQL